MMISLSSDGADPHPARRPGPLDDRAPADGCARRVQRRDLGPEGAPAPGPRRPRAAGPLRRHPRPGHQHDRQRAVGVAAHLPRGVDAGDAVGSSTRTTSGSACSTSRRSRRPTSWPGSPSRGPAPPAPPTPSGAAAPLRLGDVADVVEDHQALIGDAVVNGGDGLILVVEKLPDTSTTAVTTGIEDALEAMEAGLDGVVVDTGIYRPATYLERRREQPGPLGRDRGRPARRRPGCLPLQLAPRADQPRRHRLLAAGRDRGALPAGGDLQRGRHRRPGHGGRRASSTTPRAASSASAAGSATGRAVTTPRHRRRTGLAGTSATVSDAPGAVARRSPCWTRRWRRRGPWASPWPRSWSPAAAVRARGAGR